MTVRKFIISNAPQELEFKQAEIQMALMDARLYYWKDSMLDRSFTQPQKPRTDCFSWLW